MTVRAGITRTLLALAMSVTAARAEAQPDREAPLLGRAHVGIKYGQADFSHDAAATWGVDREGYSGLEGYGGGNGGQYVGGEISRVRAGSATTAGGDSIRDFDFLSLEINWKQVFDLHRGWTFGLGTGGALFWADGEEVSTSNGREFSDPLADLGYGLQGFVDFSWRVRRLILGLEAKYQLAFDVLYIDYSNFRIGGHIGMAF